MNSDQIFARNLEAIRLAKGYTHENLAHDADITRSYIWNLKNATNSASLETLDKLAKVLEVEPWQLLVPGLVVESVPEAEADTIEASAPLPPLKVVKNQTSKRKLRG
jgi:transcriptional regulator with XRE-family HTH domain